MKVFFLTLLLASCALKDPKPASKSAGGTKKPEVSIESKQLANQEQSQFVTEVQFQEAKASISKSAQEDLQKLYKEASAKRKVGEVKVITWGDREYPSEKDKALSDKQKKLVDQRNEALTNYLNKITKEAEVKTYSMAERPGALNEFLSTESADIKESLETAGIPTTDKSVKVPRKASKSIVIFIMEEG